MKDGPILFYSKKGIVYPVILDRVQEVMFESMIPSLGTLDVVNVPIGRAQQIVVGSEWDDKST